MKNLLLGIMISAVSLSFAQTDGAQHPTKRLLPVKAQMQVKPQALVVVKNSPELAGFNRKVENVAGIVHIIDGSPVIYTFEQHINRRLVPQNLPKNMATEGQKIRFSYTISESKTTLDGTPAMLVNLQNVSIALK